MFLEPRKRIKEFKKCQEGICHKILSVVSLDCKLYCKPSLAKMNNISKILTNPILQRNNRKSQKSKAWAATTPQNGEGHDSLDTGIFS